MNSPSPLNEALKRLTKIMSDVLGHQPVLIVAADSTGKMFLYSPSKLEAVDRQMILETIEAWVKK